MVLGFLVLGALVLGAFAGCNGTESHDPWPSALHLFDRPPLAATLPEVQFSDEVSQVLSGETLWIVAEELPAARFVRRKGPTGEPLWRATTRFPVQGPGRLVSVPEAADPAAGRELAAGAAPDLGPREVVIDARGVTLAGSGARPDALSVSYRTSVSTLHERLSRSQDPAAGAPLETRELTLAEDTRRVLPCATPSKVSWELELPEAAQVVFSFALQKVGLERNGAGLSFSGSPASGCWFQLTLRAQGLEPHVLWGRAVQPEEAGGFIDVSVDLSEFAGRTVELEWLARDGAQDAAGSGSGGDSGSESGSESGRALFALWAEPILQAPDPEAPPNVLVLLLDTLRADRLGCYGWERAATPNIDALAARGVRFADVMSAAPWTLPAHASLFSSLYVSEHGLWSQKQRLPAAVTTVAEVLRARGYRTAAFTEGGFVRAEFGFAQGFDTFQAERRGVSETFGLARDWIEAAGAPFFAFVQTYQIHTPLDPPTEHRALVRPYAGQLPESVHIPDYIGPGGRKVTFEEADLPYVSDLYDAEVAYVDREVGRLLEFLEQAGLAANTLVIVTSDHGEELGEHGHFDHGWSLYQDQLSVPLVLYLPGRFEGGSVVEHTVHGVDVAPTLALLAGAQVPEVWSGVPLSLAAPRADRPLITPFLTRRKGKPAIAIRSGTLKFIDYPTGERPLDAQDTGPKLYDLAQDPSESTNLWSTRASERWQKVADAFRRRYSRFSAADGAREAAGSNAALMKELGNLGYGGDE